MMDTTCIMCPMGCALTITEENGVVTVTGNTCPRGAKYGVSEYTDPKRMVTTLVKVRGGGVLSVKTSAPIRKTLVPAALKAAAGVLLDHSVHAGDVVLADVAGSGEDLIATADLVYTEK
ncbi:MAG: DUF1667 domain-containing protein [Clostridia bacterium]|nr:DUF1667 domain-containing protein [Clostridia bacterium]